MTPDIPSVTIDAGVIAIPQSFCTDGEVYEYVRTLLDWSTLLDKPWIAIYMSEKASQALMKDDLYPLRDELKKLFETHKIIEYSVKDIATIVDRLLRITPSFETYYHLKDVLIEDLETEPDILRLTTCDGLQTDLARCVVLIAILRKHCLQPLGGHSLILKKAPRKVIEVRAQIHCLEHERNDIPDLPSPPQIFEGDVLVCDDLRGLIECLDESAVLIGASDNLGIELAIRIAVFKDALIQGEEPDWENISVPKIGTEFRETCQQCCGGQPDSLPLKILRSIVKTVRRDNSRATHALRTGPGGNDPQLMRGEDKAWRRDIDDEFHLHYWECSERTIELASVVHHNNFSIPE